MPLFRYIAIDAEGTTVSDRIDAADETAARRQLEQAGLKVENIETIPAEPVAPERAVPELSTAEAARLVGHVGDVASAGLPLAPTLESLAEDLAGGRLAAALKVLSAKLEKGEPLDHALESLSGQFPAHVRGIISAGLRTGRLGEVLERFSLQQRLSRDLWRSIWLAIAYPCVAISLLAVLSLFYLLFLVPMFKDIYFDFQMDLPVMTVFVIWLSNHVLLWFSVAMGLIVGIPLLVSLIFGRGGIHRLRIGVPLFGPLWSWAGLGEFCRLLSTLLAYKIPLPDALRLTADSVRDLGVGSACRKLSKDAAAGRSLDECVAQSFYFPPSLVPLVAWGGRSDSLPEALEIAGDLCEERVHLQTELLKAVLPPIIFIVIAAVVAMLIFSMLFPLYGLVNGLAG